MKNDHKTKLRLMFLLHSCGVGGAEMQVVTLINRLDPDLFEISLVYIRNETELLSKLDHTRLLGGAHCLHSSGKIDIRAIRRFLRIVTITKPNLLICTNMFPLIFAWIARVFFAKEAKVFEIFHSTKLGSRSEKLKMLFFYPLCWAAHCLVYVCDNQRQFWRRRLLVARRSQVIHNGADASYFSNNYSPQQIASFRNSFGFGPQTYIVGICAYMRPEKFHTDLIQAIFSLNERGILVRCLMIGDGPERKNLEKLIGELNLSEYIKITGLMNDVRLAMAACDVITITSHCVETFSIAALESMLMGKPLIMSDIGGASEQIEHGFNGLLYKPGDLRTLAAHLNTMRVPDERRRMGANARRVAITKYSIDRMVAAYSKLFASML